MGGEERSVPECGAEPWWGAQAGEAAELLERREGSAQASSEDAAHKHRWAFLSAGSSLLQTKASPCEGPEGQGQGQDQGGEEKVTFDWLQVVTSPSG